jgi:hypothetical protein
MVVKKPLQWRWSEGILLKVKSLQRRRKTRLVKPSTEEEKLLNRIAESDSEKRMDPKVIHLRQRLAQKAKREQALSKRSAKLLGKPYAANPLVRFDEGEG